MDSNNKLGTIVGNHHVKRAIEVALVDNHSIGFLGNQKALNLAFKAIADLYGLEAYAATPCPCGSYASQRTACLCSGKKVKKHQRKKAFKRTVTADIVVTPVLPLPYEKVTIFDETFDHDMLLRVEKATAVDTINVGLCDTGQRLMNSAIQVLNLSYDQSWGKIMVALSIAKLDGKNTIEPVHLAEAMQYVARSGYLCQP